MSRHSSRSSKSTRWHSTPKLSQADISLVFADSIQVSSSPGAAAATLPRQSTLQANDAPLDMNTLANDKVQDNTISRFVSRSSNTLLSTVYSNKRRQNSAAVSRIERVVQPELCPGPELMSSESEFVPSPDLNKFDGLVEASFTNQPSDPPEQSTVQAEPATSVVREVVSGEPAEHPARLQDESSRSAEKSNMSTEESNLQRNENNSGFRPYISSYLFPIQIFSSGSERENKDQTHSAEVASIASPSEPQMSDAVPDAVPLESLSEKPTALPSTTWLDYLRFPISVIPGFRSSNPDAAPILVSPKSDECIIRPEIEVVSPVLSNDVGDSSSWFTWAWWRSSPRSGSNMNPTSAAVNPEVESAQRSFRAASPGPMNPIGASRETKAGWLSVLASTNARRRAIMEQGETMEVVIVDEESVVPTKPEVLDDTSIHRSNPSEGFDTTKTLDVSAATSVVSPKSQSPSFLVLPTFEDTFDNPPRSIPLPKEVSTLHRTVNYVARMLFNDESKDKGKTKEKEVPGKELPKTWSVLEEDPMSSLSKIKRVVVVGIHGWFPGAFIRQVLGEPTGTSEKFANMLEKTAREYFEEYGVTLEKVTRIILQGGGTVSQRVNSLYQDYLSHEDWVNDLQTADAILFGTHSQGSIVTTQIIDRLIEEGHIRTPSSSLLASPQYVGVLALCGVHNGPFLHLNSSYLMNPYIQYFESAAARELFEFQDSESPVSKTYVTALSNCLRHGVKFTYIASLNDQVVPIYSGAFVTATHPLILRALYIDGDAYHSTDFLSNLLVLLFKVRNSGLDDNGLVAHLSEATAGSLTGVGHSKAYEAPASYRLAIRFLFETSGVIGSNHDLIVEPFTARAARNDYEIPWALRDLIANPDVAAFFVSEFSELRSAFDDWHPRTAVLRDIRRKLEPIRRLNTARL